MTETIGNVSPLNVEELTRAAEGIATAGGDSNAAVEALACLVDSADDEDNTTVLVKAIELAEGIEAKCLPKDACLVRYYRSNAWAGLRRLRSTPAKAWSWEQPELLEQIYWLRAAIQHEGYAQLPAPRRAQFHCNLGNALSEAGRFVDALDEWRCALDEQPMLGMAHGSLGKGLVQYGTALYDEGHAYWFLRRGQRELAQAVAGGVNRDGSTYPSALAHFEACLADVERLLGADATIDDEELSTFSLGKSRREQQYRQWSLERHLFLNPLNDLGVNSIAAQDVLCLPSHRVKGAGVTFLAFFNQLKQEYAYARWCLYEGSSGQRVHLADRGVRLALNSDYALYAMGLEQVKTAFRCAYSLLDKVAFFVNDYWQLGIAERKVNFRSVWFEVPNDKGTRGQVRQVFETSKNLPLRGLFWLAKDIYFEELRGVAHPNAQDLDSLRNHLEHKYVKVVDFFAGMTSQSDIFADRLAHKVNRDELLGKTERLLQLSRSALIYLCLAMHVEEQRTLGSLAFAFSLDVGTYPDGFKV